MTATNPIIAAALDLLWSQWSELGVPGLRSEPSGLAISPVDLVLYTPAIVGARDERLGMLVQAWCAAHGARVFGARELSGRRASLTEPVQDAFDSWTAVLREVGSGPWPEPSAPQPSPGPPIGDRAVPLRADRSAAVQLRARSLFGVGVRADAMCALLAAEAEERAITSADLSYLGHSARAAQLTLAAFEAAGVVRTNKAPRSHSFRLTHPEEWARLLDAEQLQWLPWHHAFPIVFHLVQLAAFPSAKPRVHNVRAHALASLLARHAFAIHQLPPIEVRPGDEDARAALLAWGERAIEVFATGGRRR